MKTILAFAITITVLGSTSPAVAVPEPDRLGCRAAERVEAVFPFDAGSAPLRHIDGQDWLPARRVS